MWHKETKLPAFRAIGMHGGPKKLGMCWTLFVPHRHYLIIFCKMYSDQVCSSLSLPKDHKKTHPNHVHIIIYHTQYVHFLLPLPSCVLVDNLYKINIIILLRF